MILDGYTLAYNPRIRGTFEPKKKSSFKRTFTDVAYFNWGETVKGLVVTLSWDAIPESMWDTLLAKYSADAQVVVDPEDGSGNTFNVVLPRIDGEYYLYQSSAGSFAYRRNVELDLLIISQV